MNEHTILDFVKAMTDAERLRIVGMLTQRAATPKEVADELHMPLRDSVDHLAFMQHVGIVRENEGRFELDTKGLEALAQSQFKGQPRESYAPAPDLKDKSRKVLAAFLNADGSIKQIPSDAGKLQVILDYLVETFTPGVVYTEKEVNTLIRRFNVDTAGLRRDMIDRGMLERKSDGSQYWRPDRSERSETQSKSGSIQPSTTPTNGSAQAETQQDGEL